MHKLPEVDASEAQRLIAGGETMTVEFKVDPLNDTELVEAVACLANGSGGVLFVGVRNDGTLAGARPRHGRTTEPARVASLVANRTEPSVVASVDVFDLEGNDVLVVEVPAAHAVVATNEGKFVRRALDIHGQPQCLPMRPHEVLSRAGSLGAQDFARVAHPGITVDDLDETEFARLRSLARSGGDPALAELSPVETLKALDLIAPSGDITIGAVLVFGSQDALARWTPAFEVTFQELDDLAVRATETRRVPLLRAMFELADRVKARNPEEEVEVGLLRVGLPRFADLAVRELIANALVHRDYTLVGPTVVEVTAEALSVSNPGGLPEGVTLANLLTTPPRPRNPALADAFKRAGLVDRTSRGINRVFHSQLLLGRPAPDYTRSTTRSVVARVRSGPADTELAAFLAAAQRDGQRFSLEDLLALHEVRAERRVTTGRAAQLFQVDQQAARAALNRLADRGLLESRGDGKGRTYHLSAAVFRELGAAAQYVRTRGFDDIQQEQMVLTFVLRHGSISRREASELCQVDSDTASRLLRRMRDAGKLVLVGERRGARYEAAAAAT